MNQWKYGKNHCSSNDYNIMNIRGKFEVESTHYNYYNITKESSQMNAIQVYFYTWSEITKIHLKYKQEANS